MEKQNLWKGGKTETSVSPNKKNWTDGLKALQNLSLDSSVLEENEKTNSNPVGCQHLKLWAGLGWQYLAALPAVGNVGPKFLLTNHLPHLLNRGIWLNQVVVGQLVVLMDTWWTNITLKSFYTQVVGIQRACIGESCTFSPSSTDAGMSVFQ